MGRILSLILIAFSAVGNVFSHSHECCLGIGIGERTHVHVHFACGEHSHATPSHSHEHEHPSDTRKTIGQEGNSSQRETASQNRPAELAASCGCSAHCSDCDHVIWFPELNRFLPNSKAPLQSVILQVFLEDGIAATHFFSLQTTSPLNRCSSRYAEPIYLRHSTLLL